MNKSPFNLGEALTVARKNFMEVPALTMAANSGCLFDMEKNRYIVPFLGERYLVNYPAGLVTYHDRDMEAPVIISIILLHYLSRSKGVELSGNWISFKDLQGGGIYIEPFKNRAIIPFVKNFGARFTEFSRAAEKLGGVKAEHGDLSYVIHVLPRVPLLYIIWHGDEEFPANGTILVDQYANAYLHTEDYAMLAGMTVGALVKSLKE